MALAVDAGALSIPHVAWWQSWAKPQNKTQEMSVNTKLLDAVTQAGCDS